MRHFWVYDWEIYPNFACVTFIHTSTPKNIVDAYIKVDIKFLEYTNKFVNRIRQLYNKDSDINHLDYTLEYLEQYHPDDKVIEYKKGIIQFLANKYKILDMMVSKQFFIYYDALDTKKNINHLPQLLMFFQTHKVLMGYNSFNYDSKITDYVLLYGHKFNPITCKNSNNIHFLQELYQVSQQIISSGNNKFSNYRFSWIPSRYYRTFEDYDIQKILYLDKTFTGLKSVAINLKWHRLQELPYAFDRYLTCNQIWNVYDYNINDVLITLILVWNQEEEITLREQISERYNVNVLNASRSSIGKRLMSNYYSEYSGLNYKEFAELRTHRGKMRLSTIISDRIKFKTSYFKDFLNRMKTMVITPSDDFILKFGHNQTLYNIAKGGIHSVDDSRVYDSEKDGFIYRDADVTSYYPSILIIFNIAPAHLIKEIFLELVAFFKDDRVRAKNAGEKLEAEALKIVINRIYGALKDINDYLFDPKATYETTFNGQLSLLMLIEALEESDITVISANTDGIVSKFKKEQEDTYNTICKAWETFTGFSLEYTYYERYIRINVNNYIAVKKGFKNKFDNLHTISSTYKKDLKDLEDKYIKCKGDFIYETPFSKGFINPVVALALYRYFIYDIDYRETIYNHWKDTEFGIYDYCISQKVDKKFEVLYKYVEDGEIKFQTLQQYNRFYVCKTGGGTIVKVDGKDGNADIDILSTGTSIVANQKLMLFNDFIAKSDYNIEFGYYIRQVEKILYFKTKKPKGNHKKIGISVRANDLFSQNLEDEK